MISGDAGSVELTQIDGQTGIHEAQQAQPTADKNNSPVEPPMQLDVSPQAVKTTNDKNDTILKDSENGNLAVDKISMLLAEKATRDLLGHDFSTSGSSEDLTPALRFLENTTAAIQKELEDLPANERAQTEQRLTDLKALIDGTRIRQEFHLPPITTQAEEIMADLTGQKIQDAGQKMLLLTRQPDVPPEVAQQLRRTYSLIMEAGEDGGELITDYRELHDKILDGRHPFDSNAEIAQWLPEMDRLLQNAHAIQTIAAAQNKLFDLLDEHGGGRIRSNPEGYVKVTIEAAEDICRAAAKEAAKNLSRSATDLMTQRQRDALRDRERQEPENRHAEPLPESIQLRQALAEYCQNLELLPDNLEADPEGLIEQITAIEEQMKLIREEIPEALQGKGATSNSLTNRLSMRVLGKPSGRHSQAEAAFDDIYKRLYAIDDKKRALKQLKSAIPVVRDTEKIIQILKQQEERQALLQSQASEDERKASSKVEATES